MRGIIAPALWSESSKGNDHRGVEQSVARRAHNPKVEGSSPSPATIYGGVAQLARAFGSYPECHLFESDCRYQTKEAFTRLLPFVLQNEFRCSFSKKMQRVKNERKKKQQRKENE